MNEHLHEHLDRVEAGVRDLRRLIDRLQELIEVTS
jgi:hypothetical protein